MADTTTQTPDPLAKRLERRRELVQATAKSISQRFADITDFETVADLETALEAAKREVSTINPLLLQLADVGK